MAYYKRFEKKIELPPIDPRSIEKIRNGDVDTFEKLFSMYREPLINFASRFVHNAQISEEFVQEVFLRLWSSRKHLDHIFNVKSYLYKAIKNEALKYLRHEAVEQRSSEQLQTLIPDSKITEAEWDKLDMAVAIEQAVSELPEKCRIIFCMNRFDQLSYKKIARNRNISLKTVETQISRALNFLRRRLTHYNCKH